MKDKTERLRERKKEVYALMAEAFVVVVATLALAAVFFGWQGFLLTAFIFASCVLIFVYLMKSYMVRFTEALMEKEKKNER